MLILPKVKPPTDGVPSNVQVLSIFLPIRVSLPAVPIIVAVIAGAPLKSNVLPVILLVIVVPVEVIVAVVENVPNSA